MGLPNLMHYLVTMGHFCAIEMKAINLCPDLVSRTGIFLTALPVQRFRNARDQEYLPYPVHNWSLWEHNSEPGYKTEGYLGSGISSSKPAQDNTSNSPWLQDEGTCRDRTDAK